MLLFTVYKANTCICGTMYIIVMKLHQMQINLSVSLVPMCAEYPSLIISEHWYLTTV